VYVSTPEIKQISGIVGSGLSVPTEAKAQLVDVIAAIAPHLPIQSDLPELAAHINTIAADPCIYAHLLPLQTGLRLQFLVRPLADGNWYMPAKGSANLLGEQSGVPVQAARDLTQEQRQLQAIIDGCPAISEYADGDTENADGEWQFDEPEACLELLTQLKAQEGELLQLVWPEGERFRLKGSRSLQQMRLTIKKQGEWFVAGGEISLDDGRVIALRELLQIAQNNSSGRFLKIGENDYLALTDSFRKRLAELQQFGDFAGKDGVRIHALAAPALAELAQEVGDLQADAAWRAQIENSINSPRLNPRCLALYKQNYVITNYSVINGWRVSRIGAWVPA